LFFQGSKWSTTYFGGIKRHGLNSNSKKQLLGSIGPQKCLAVIWKDPSVCRRLLPWLGRPRCPGAPTGNILPQHEWEVPEVGKSPKPKGGFSIAMFY
jgi:hypothetical protein